MSSDVFGRVPLAHRRPNPPAVLVGRVAECARLDALAAGPRVAVIEGPPGAGKSALVYAHLAEASGVVVRVEGGEPDVLASMRRVLATTAGLAPSEVHRAGDAAERIGQLLDIADALDAFVLVEDPSESGDETPQLVELLNAAIRYGRRARWYVTTRHPLEVPESVRLKLQPMRYEELEQIAHSRARHLAELDVGFAVRSALGLPGRLVRMLEGATASPLTTTARAILSSLAVLRRPVSQAALCAVASESELRALAEDGSIVGFPDAIRLHDDARDGLVALTADRKHTLAQSLEAHVSAAATLEALRLWLECGALEEALHLLGRRGDELLARGYAPDLWALLSEAQSPVFRGWQLVVATEHGHPAALAHVEAWARSEGSPATAETKDVQARFAYLKTRYAAEDYEFIREHAAAVALAAAQANRADLAWEAQLMVAASRMALGKFDETEREVRAATLPTLTAQLQAKALLALCAARRGRRAEALAIVDALEPRLSEVAGTTRASLTYNIALIFSGLGEPDRALERFEATFPVDALATAALCSRRALELGAYLNILCGTLDRAEGLLSRLAKYVVTGSPIDARRNLMLGTLWLLRGKLSCAKEHAERGLNLALKNLGDEDTAFARALLAQISWRWAERRVGNPAQAQGASGLIAHAWEVLASDAFGAPVELLTTEGVELTGEAHEALALAQACLRRDVPAVRAALGTALTLSAVSARAWLSLYALHWLLAHSEVPPVEACSTMRGITSDIDDDLDLCALAVSRAPWPTLARLASLESTAGRIARRVMQRGLPTTDREEAIAAFLRSRLGWNHVVGLPGDNAYLDVPRSLLWLDDQEVSLAAHPTLFRLLVVLIRHGGAATKEALVNETWQVREYHPLQHDNRLRLAVRKLRAQLGAKRVATRVDGYALDLKASWLAGTSPAEWLDSHPLIGS
jgi:hypothetical protein